MGVRGGYDKNHKAGVTMCTHTIKRGRRRGGRDEREKKRPKREKRERVKNGPCIK